MENYRTFGLKFHLLQYLKGQSSEDWGDCMNAQTHLGVHGVAHALSYKISCADRCQLQAKVCARNTG